MKSLKKIFIPIIMLSFLCINISSAQIADEINKFAPIQMDIPCIEAQYDLRIGARDYSLFGDVMKLQLFLYQNEIMYHPPTGYFGPITQSALAKYQSLRGLSSTGYFDYETRHVLANETCNNIIPDSSPSNSYDTTNQNDNTYNVDGEGLFNQDYNNIPQNNSGNYDVNGQIFSS